MALTKRSWLYTRRFTANPKNIERRMVPYVPRTVTLSSSRDAIAAEVQRALTKCNLFKIKVRFTLQFFYNVFDQ